jgi:preprotein translocase subunit SecA
MVSRAIEAAQAKIEGFNFDVRKHVLEYDNVLSKQRDTIYSLRKEILFGDENVLKAHLDKMITSVSKKIIKIHTQYRSREEWDIDSISEFVYKITNENLKEEIENRLNLGLDEASQYIENILRDKIFERFKENEDFLKNAKIIVLRIIDMLWMEHLELMESLRDSVRLRAYGQRDPLIEYKREGHILYKELLEKIDITVLTWISKITLYERAH